jgi:hypothetical protein
MRGPKKMRISLRSICLFALFALAAFVSPPFLPEAPAEERIALCHAGLITLLPFDQHIKKLRSSTRYEPKVIDDLIAREHKGAPNFFSSQIIVQGSASGSGTFDLRMIHGISDATHYRNVTAWACRAEDYPILYFIGFRVRSIEDSTIFVSREKDIVNVISLNRRDANLEKHLKIMLYQSEKVLCRDIDRSCNDDIFYDRQ